MVEPRKNKWSPLQRNDTLRVRLKHVQQAAHFQTVPLRMGHSVQYAHDDAYLEAGWDAKPSGDMAAFDRMYAGHLHDDKTASWVRDKITGLWRLSEKHSVKHQEHVVWENQRKNDDKDVIIHSFELVAPFEDGVEFDVIYRGPCSWWNARLWLTEEKDDYSFYRASAVRNSPY